MTTSPACLVCAGPIQPLVGGRDLMGGTTKADRLHKFRLSQCRVCGHVQKELNEDWHAAMDGLYERHYHDYRIVGRQVNFVSGKIVGRDGLAVRKLDELIGLPEEGAILDIGCGAGRFLEAFGQEKAGWKLAGYDVGDLHKDQVLAIPDARFFHGLGELPKIADRFDLITLNHVVEHLTEPVVVLREAAQLLKPGGRLVIRVPCFEAVNTDFFLLEHCSHFTLATLAYALSLAGLRVSKTIEGLSAIEVGVIAQITATTGGMAAPEIAPIAGSARKCLAWAESLPAVIRAQPAGRRKGLLGVGGAGLWLGVLMRGEIDFYVDEDPGKQGHHFAGCPIIAGSAIPEGALVIVTFNSPDAAKGLCDRLRHNFPQREFFAPPAIEAP